MSNLICDDKQYIANTYNRFPLEITHGNGSLVYGADGKRYIDMGSGIGVTSFGIADDKWIAAIEDQLSKVQHMSNLYYTSPCVKLAKLLCEKTGMKKVFFANSGAEANECAIKIARKYAAEKKGEDTYTIVSLRNSFHGRTLTTLAATGQEHYHELFTPLTPGFCHIDAGDDIFELEAMAAHRKIAAIMIECVQGEGGVIPLNPIFAKKINDYCKKNDILLIVDEVQTGNGRCGKMYAYMKLGLCPDIVSTAKGIGGGLPLGAVLISEKAENVLGYGDHGSTFGGNPIACAGAISIVERLSDEFLCEVEKKSEYVFSELEGAEGIEAVTGMGLMIGIKTKAPASDLVKKCMEKGVLCLTAKDKLRLLPALNIPMDILKEAIDVIKDVCKER